MFIFIECKEFCVLNRILCSSLDLLRVLSFDLYSRAGFSPGMITFFLNHGHCFFVTVVKHVHQSLMNRN